MDAMLRQPAVAGTFYPADPTELANQVGEMIRSAREHPVTPKAIVAPHAGYRFSGPTAGHAYRTLLRRNTEIERVVLVGPNHRMPLKGMAVASQDFWATPLGPVAIDWESVRAILDDPAVTVNDAPFAGEHGLEVHLPFLIRSLCEFKLVPILIGETPMEDVARVLKKLWGGPETLIVVSSDLSHYHDYDTARAKDLAALKAIECLQPEALRDDQACGRFSIKGLLSVARDYDLRATVLDYCNSGDRGAGKNSVVGYGSVAFEYASDAKLKDGIRTSLSGLVRKVIGSALKTGNMPNLEAGPMPPEMRAHRATFVTLTLDGKLRGCIGSTAPHRPLFEDVATNGYKAAFGDPRFPNLTHEEAGRVHVHVSILSTPRPILAESDVDLGRQLHPDRDGLILTDGKYRSLFLPQVWESIHQPEDFIAHLKRKAGLPADHWSPTLTWHRFGVESFGG
ncbi:MAG: AmmeMemoRadiSam system protein B [Alphaproteobacteria bacterium]|nr:AmmeMemoRadiSam system protein B [Alphaproteobacteria bacterium]